MEEEITRDSGAIECLPRRARARDVLAVAGLKGRGPLADVGVHADTLDAHLPGVERLTEVHVRIVATEIVRAGIAIV